MRIHDKIVLSVAIALAITLMANAQQRGMPGTDVDSQPLWRTAASQLR